MTEATEPEVILEPGDPGYVEPGTEPPVPEPAPPQAGPAPPGQDLTQVRDPREHEAEFLARTRNVPVRSTSPTDIVPNMPQITFSPQEPPLEAPAEETPA